MASQEGDQDAQNAMEADPLIGQTVGGRFVIKGRIARGGMACVYSATQTQVDRPVAIKVLRPSLDELTGSVSDFRRRFLQEASILSRLQHPNLVTLLDYGQMTDGPGDRYYIAMEYLRGETLSRRFRTRGRLDVAQTIRIARQIGRGLREAHRQGFIHRDLKPSNIMLVPEDDENDIVKLIDFGIGKAIERRPQEERRVDGVEPEELTRVGLLLGSPRYMAPEQIRGDAVEARTDLYGLGIILYQALTGRLPFEGQSHMDTMLAHCSSPPPPLDEFLELPASSLSELVADLLKKHPSQRPTTDEFLARLAAVEQDLFESVGLAGPTLLGARFSLPPPSDGSGAQRVPPPGGWRRSSPPPRRPSPPPPPRPSRSDHATVVTTGTLASPPGLAAPKPLTPSSFEVPLPSESRLRPSLLETPPSRPPVPPRFISTPPVAPLEPHPALSLEPQSPPRPRRGKMWALLLLPALGVVFWLGTRASADSEAPAPPVPSAASLPTSFTLRLASTPAAAIVKENGTVLGQTPLRLAIDRASVMSAPRRFMVEREGYASYAHEQADSSGDVEVVAPLVPEESPPSTSAAQRSRAKVSTPQARPAASTPAPASASPRVVRSLDINLER